MKGRGYSKRLNLAMDPIEIHGSWDEFLAVTSIVTSVTSILGTLLIVFSFVKLRTLRTVVMKTLLSLSVACFGLCVASILNAVGYYEFKALTYADGNVTLGNVTLPNNKLCISVTAMTTFFYTAVCLWTCTLAVVLLISVDRDAKRISLKLFLYLSLFSWTIPAIVTIITMVLLKVGQRKEGATFSTPVISWCGINASPLHTWQLFTGRGWEIASYLFCAICFGLIHYKLNQRKQLKKESGTTKCGPEASYGQPFLKLRFILPYFIFLRMWGMLRFFLDWNEVYYRRKLPNTNWIFFFMGFGNNSQGLIIAILLCFYTKSIRTKLYDETLGKLYRNPSLNSSLTENTGLLQQRPLELVC